MQVCLHCGSANSPGNKECHSCGQSFGDVENEAPSAPQAANDSGLRLCNNCTTEIGFDEPTCPNCGIELPEIDFLDRPAPKSHEKDITTRYESFARAIEKLRSQRMSRTEFLEWLETLAPDLLGKRTRYVERVKEFGFFEENPDEVEMCLTGILEYEESIMMMGGACQTEEMDFAVLDHALQKMWEGNEKINEAMRLNRAYRAKMEEDWGYM